MKFKIDENLPQEVAAVLRGSGHDAVSVFDQALSGKATPAYLPFVNQKGAS